MQVEQIREKINLKTKPLGALGQLEELVMQICKVQNTLSPVLNNPTILVFAADHGIAQEGLSAYPAEVTPQMVLNFLSGGAAINVFCRQHQISLKIVDAGVNFDFDKDDKLIEAKIAKGTRNFFKENAMTVQQLQLCFEKAEEIISQITKDGCNIIGFGEMGIANTSSASMLMAYLCNLPIEQCVGKGTGLKDQQLQNKIEVLKQAQQNHRSPASVQEALEFYGGFEIAQICSAMLAAHKNNMLIMIDGFIATVAFLCANRIDSNIIQHAIFCHQSDELGHKAILNSLNVKPLLNLGMRLGEGTGCAVAYPIIQSAVVFMNEMASFEDAGVSEKS